MPEAPREGTSPTNIVPFLDGQAILDLLLAKGLPRWEAVGLVAGAQWTRAVQPRWERFARRVRSIGTLLKALDQVAAGSPETANRWLGEWLVQKVPEGMVPLGGRRWVASLPPGLRVTHGLFLFQSPIRALPLGLQVGGNLYLDQSAITTLPEGLEVGASLWLRECPAWDGRIPADARVADRVYTSRHKGGLSLEHWRHRHPQGEREPAYD